MTHKTQKQWSGLTFFCVVLLSMGLAIMACQPGEQLTSAPAPHPSLAGVYEASYASLAFAQMNSLTGIERLIIRADGTYQQVYKDYTSPWLSWHIDADKRLHLEGGRFWGGGQPDGKYSGTILTVNLEKITMRGELILTPTSDGQGLPKFYSPLIGDPDVDEYLTYQWVGMEP